MARNARSEVPVDEPSLRLIGKGLGKGNVVRSTKRDHWPAICNALGSVLALFVLSVVSIFVLKHFSKQPDVGPSQEFSGEQIARDDNTYPGQLGNTPAVQSDDQLSKAVPEATMLNDKPRGDKRQYQYATLANGLKVLNVQDPKTTQAAFSVAVDAGSLDNPEKLPGLAHFCEHMLFLGTKKYPEPSGFDDFISSAGGYNNAFTADEHTVYFTQVSAPTVEQGLSRFADFFHDPLFNRKYVDKEVNAIDSEHAKNLQDQSRRTFEIFEAIANPKHPATRFKTGNLQTLGIQPKAKGIDPVTELKKWFKENYCPSRMRLATFGPEPLDEQLKRANKDFADIPVGTESCSRSRRWWADLQEWPADRLGHFVAIKGTVPQKQLWIQFPLPDISKYYKSMPLLYINFVLSYGGEQSLRRFLQDKLGLVNSFGISADGGSSGYNVFLVAQLNNAGRKNFLIVLHTIFYYLASLAYHGIDEQLYKSLGDISALEWDWNEPSGPADTASGLAEEMINTPMPDVLSAGSRLDNPNTTLVSELLELLRPDNMNVGIIDPDAEKTLFQDLDEQKELPYYKAKYALSDFKRAGFPTDVWASWFKQNDVHMFGQSNQNRQEKAQRDLLQFLKEANMTQDVHALPIIPLPIKNVPTSLNVDHMHANTKVDGGVGLINKFYGQSPDKVSTTHKGTGAFTSKLWYRSGWVTETPKMQVSMQFTAPRAQDSWEPKPDDSIKLSIYNSLLGEEMNPKMADLSMTGVSYSVQVAPHSVSFSFGGFAPTIPELMDKVLQEFDKGVDVNDTARYDRIIQEINESLNTYDGMPVQYATQDRNILLSPGMVSRKEQQEALGRMTPTAVASSPQDLVMLKPMELSGLGMGNVASDAVQAAFEKIQTRAASWRGANAHPNNGEEIRLVPPVVNPGKPVELRRLNQRPRDPNDVLVSSFLVGVKTVESRILYGLLSSILSQAAYTELRTNRQYGYVVSGGISSISNVHYVSCVVQGDRARADELEAACEHVYTNIMPLKLQNMTDAELASHKSSVEQMLITPPASFGEEFGHFWENIVRGGDCFKLEDELLEYLRSGSISKQTLIDAWNELIYPAQNLRQKVVIKHFATKVPKAPSLADYRAMWAKERLSDRAVKLLEKERAETILLTKADSDSRKILLADLGSLYPPDLHCTRAATKAAAIEQSSKPSAAKDEKVSHKFVRNQGKRQKVNALIQWDELPTVLQPE